MGGGRLAGRGNTRGEMSRGGMYHTDYIYTGAQMPKRLEYSHVTGAITHDTQNNGPVAMRAPPSDGYKASLSNLLI